MAALRELQAAAGAHASDLGSGQVLTDSAPSPLHFGVFFGCNFFGVYPFFSLLRPLGSSQLRGLRATALPALESSTIAAWPKPTAAQRAESADSIRRKKGMMLQELYELCPMANWAPIQSLDAWGWIGVSLHLGLMVGVLAGLALLLVWAVRRVRVPAARGPDAPGQPPAHESLQAHPAQGEVTGEQPALMNQGVG
jgi:hypothetical protein